MKSNVKSERLKKSALALRLEITRPTLDRILAIAGAPEADGKRSYDVEECIAWLSEHASVGSAGGKKDSIQHWKMEEVKLRCTRMQDQIARDRGEYISKASASRTILPMIAELGELMRQKFILELPSRYKGKDQVECQEMNEKAVDDISRRYREGMSELIVED